MKITIYDLLGMIKDGKIVNKIMYKSKLWEYDNQDKDYFTNHYDGTEWLFDEYVITDILNDEVEILEQDNIENNKQKLKDTLNCIKDSETILGGEYYVIHSDFIIALEEIIEAINERIV